MFGTMGAVASPEIRQKRPFQNDVPYSMDEGLPKKRLCEGAGVLSAGQDSTAGDDIGEDLTTTAQADASDQMATENESYFQISSEMQQYLEPEEPRGRTRWREGSEPFGWDDSEWTRPRNMAASFDDGPGEEQNPTRESNAGTVKAD